MANVLPTKKSGQMYLLTPPFGRNHISNPGNGKYGCFNALLILLNESWSVMDKNHAVRKNDRSIRSMELAGKIEQAESGRYGDEFSGCRAGTV
jgi:hypothetical protein